jgi:hypothetical protein
MRLHLHIPFLSTNSFRYQNRIVGIAQLNRRNGLQTAIGNGLYNLCAQVRQQIEVDLFQRSRRSKTEITS